jgi:hypothetical protein
MHYADLGHGRQSGAGGVVGQFDGPTTGPAPDKVDPNDTEWMLLVGRAKALVEAVASAAGLLPDRLLRPGQGDV